MQLPTLIKIKPYDQTLQLEFENNVQGDVVFTASFFRGPFHTPLQDIAVFSRVEKDELDMLIWPNGFGLSLFEIYQCLSKKGIAYVS